MTHKRRFQWVHRSLVITGAFIVFATFYIKDYLRDKAKEDLDRITQLQSEYNQNVRQSQILEAIRFENPERRTNHIRAISEDAPTIDDLSFEMELNEEINFDQELGRLI